MATPEGKMNFYIAAKFEEYERVRAFADLLEGNGHRFTFDWTAAARRQRDGTELTPDNKKLRYYGYLDTSGVKDAHVLFVYPHPHLMGGLFEMGIAMGQDKLTIVLGDPDEFKTERCPFLHMDHIVWTTEEAALGLFAA